MDLREIKELKTIAQHWDSVDGVIARALIEIAVQLERLNNNYIASQQKINQSR